MAKQSSKGNSSGLGPRGTGPSRAKPMVKKPGFGVNPGGMGKPGKATSGGGAQSNKYTKVPTVGGPPKTRVVSPDAVSNIGRQVGNHAFDSGGRDMQRPGVPLYTGTMPQVPWGTKSPRMSAEVAQALAQMSMPPAAKPAGMAPPINMAPSRAG